MLRYVTFIVSALFANIDSDVTSDTRTLFCYRINILLLNWVVFVFVRCILTKWGVATTNFTIWTKLKICFHFKDTGIKFILVEVECLISSLV